MVDCITQWIICVSNSLVQPFDSYPAGIEAAQNMKVYLYGRKKTIMVLNF